MPRIDPCTLLKTLGVLLSPEGGIRSSDEVTRLAHLMHKFPKKLVSKCIYIQILQATTAELVAKFLDEEGWDRLNAWFSDAILDKNWPHCKELIKLFLICPMSVSRLKDNKILKLMKQLTCYVEVDGEVGSLAAQVLKKWMATPSPAKEPVAVAPLTDSTVVSSCQNNSKQSYSIALMDGGLNGKKGKLSLKSRKNAAIEDSESDGKYLLDDKTKPVPLLNGLNKEVLESVKKEKEIKSRHAKNYEKESKKGLNKKIVKENKKLEKPKERKHNASERVKKETEKQSEKDQREKKSKPYSQTELKDDLGDVERNRIKIMAQKMKNDLISRKDSSFKGGSNVSRSMTTGLGKIPKIHKTENKEKGVHGFNDLMGALDSNKVKKTVKVAPSKNKNKELMESLSSTNISKQPALKPKPIKKAARPSLESRAQSHKSIINGDKFMDLKSEKITQNKIIAPNKSEKRPAEFNLPIALKESNIFGDALGTVIHDDIALIDDRPRKKKIRLSDIRNEKDAAETEKIESEKEVGNKEILPTFSFYGGGEESRNNKMEIDSGQSLNEEVHKESIHKHISDSEVELKEATVSIPREVFGILVIAKGSTSIKKNIRWETDENLVRIEYFEMDETERINVNKVKFDTMRQREAAMEKTGRISLVNNGLGVEEEDNCNDNIPWRLVKMDSEPPLEDYGNDSNEKLVQTEREKTVLQALIFNNKKPPDLSEPDFCVIPEEVPIIVPLEDTSEGAENSLIDYSISGWPRVIGDYVPTSGSFLSTTNFNYQGSAVQPGMKNGFMGCPTLPLDNDPLPAQGVAVETMRREGFLTSHSQFEGGMNRHPNQINKGLEFQESGPMKPNMQTLQNFYGNGMENVNHFGPEPYSNGFYPQGNHPFQSDKDQGINNWGRNRGSARGFPLSGLNNRGFGNMGGIAERGFGNEQNGLKDGKTDRRGKKPNNRGKKQESRPCKFWMEKGNCKHGDRCRFKHPSH